jgi:hypothetical protein
MSGSIQPILNTVLGTAMTAGGALTGNPGVIMGGAQELTSGIGGLAGGQPATTGGASPGPLGTPAPGLAGLGSMSGTPAATQGAPLVGGQPANAPNAQQQQQGPQAPPTPPQPPSLGSASATGDVGALYLDYLAQSNLRKMKNPNAYASAHSTPEGPGISGLELPQMQTQLPQL